MHSSPFTPLFPSLNPPVARHLATGGFAMRRPSPPAPLPCVGEGSITSTFVHRDEHFYIQDTLRPRTGGAPSRSRLGVRAPDPSCCPMRKGTATAVPC